MTGAGANIGLLQGTATGSKSQAINTLCVAHTNTGWCNHNAAAN